MKVDLIRRYGTCRHCGRADVGTWAAGQAVMHGELLCHPKVAGRPDCLKLVLMFGHPFDCRCEERYPIAGDRSRSIWA